MGIVTNIIPTPDGSTNCKVITSGVLLPTTQMRTHPLLIIIIQLEQYFIANFHHLANEPVTVYRFAERC